MALQNLFQVGFKKKLESKCSNFYLGGLGLKFFFFFKTKYIIYKKIKIK